MAWVLFVATLLGGATACADGSGSGSGGGPAGGASGPGGGAAASTRLLEATVFGRYSRATLSTLVAPGITIENGYRQIAARGASITTYIDGVLVNQLTHDEFQRGPVIFSPWESRVRYRRARYRLLA